MTGRAAHFAFAAVMAVVAAPWAIAWRSDREDTAGRPLERDRGRVPALVAR